MRSDHAAALLRWRMQRHDPVGPTEHAIVAESLAEAGDETALAYIERLRGFEPVEADAILARLRLRQGKIEEAIGALSAAFEGYRADPWPMRLVMQRALSLGQEAARRAPAATLAVVTALNRPFAIRVLEGARIRTLLALSSLLGSKVDCVKVLKPLEPHVPWYGWLLEWRSRCYRNRGHPRAGLAIRELSDFRLNDGDPLTRGLVPPAR